MGGGGGGGGRTCDNFYASNVCLNIDNMHELVSLWKPYFIQIPVLLNLVKTKKNVSKLQLLDIYLLYRCSDFTTKGKTQE